MFLTFGDIVGNIGNKLGIPELGVSEFLNGQPTPQTPQAKIVTGVLNNAVNGNKTSQVSTNNVVSNPQPATDQQVVSTYNPQAAAAAAQRAQLQAQIDQLDKQQGIGLGNIDNSYNLSANRLDQQNAAAQRDYNTQVGQNGQSYANTRNGIQQNNRATNLSLIHI
jgi:hypothetical protein